MTSRNGRDGFLDGMVGERVGGLSSACMSVLHGTSKGGVVEPRTKVRFPLLLCENGAAESSDSGDQCQVSIPPIKLEGKVVDAYFLGPAILTGVTCATYFRFC